MILFISEDNIKNETIIGNNTDGAYIRTAIEKAQDIHLYGILGSQLYKKLEQLIADGSIDDEENAAYKYLLDEYISKYLKYQVVADIIIPVSFKVRNAGLVQNQDGQHYSQAYTNDLQKVSDNYTNSAAEYSLRLTKYIWANRYDYPEYCKCHDCSDTHPDRFEGYKTNINI